MKCSSVILVILKCILSATNIAIPVFLCLLFTWYLFYPFTFNQFMSFYLKQVLVDSIFIHSANLYLLTGVFSPLTFNVIINMTELRYISLFIYLFCLSLVFCVPLFLLYFGFSKFIHWFFSCISWVIWFNGCSKDYNMYA